MSDDSQILQVKEINSNNIGRVIQGEYDLEDAEGIITAGALCRALHYHWNPARNTEKKIHWYQEKGLSPWLLKTHLRSMIDEVPCTYIRSENPWNSIWDVKPVEPDPPTAAALRAEHEELEGAACSASPPENPEPIDTDPVGCGESLPSSHRIFHAVMVNGRCYTWSCNGIWRDSDQRRLSQQSVERISLVNPYAKAGTVELKPVSQAEVDRMMAEDRKNRETAGAEMHQHEMQDYVEELT